MAKPVIASFLWATDVNYSTGPAALIGTATKVLPPTGESDEGWKADQKPPAQWENFKENLLTLYVDWVRDGSSAAGLDAHIVETDSTGKTFIAESAIGGTAKVSALAALIVSANSGGGKAALMTAGTITALEVSTSGTGANAAIDATCDGTAPAIAGTTGGGGPGVKGQALLVAGDGVEGIGFGSGEGVRGTGGATGTGGEFTSGASGGFGVRGIAQSSSPAVQGEGNSGSASSEGVQGVAGNDGAIGVRGLTTVTATAGVPAVQGDGRGSGDGVKGLATAGYGVVMESDTTTPTRAAGRIVPQDTDPSTIDPGALWALDEGGSDLWMKWARGATKKYLWDGIFPRGEDGFDHTVGALPFTSISTKATAQFSATKLGDVIITVRGGLSSTSTAQSMTMTIESEDNGGGNLAAHETSDWIVATTTNSTTAAAVTAVAQLKVSPLTAVLRDYRVRFATTGGATGRVFDVSIRVEGEFN